MEVTGAVDVSAPRAPCPVLEPGLSQEPGLPRGNRDYHFAPEPGDECLSYSKEDGLSAAWCRLLQAFP
ncbi:MAG: hypothetical protein WC832_13130, partial [Anaerolineales bacterium]